MKKLIVVGLSALMINSVSASETLEGYYKTYSVNSTEYKRVIAKKRASEHPRGSGVGTTRYNIKYNRNYSVDKYKRKD